LKKIFKGLHLITNKHKYTAMKSYFSFLFIFLLALTSCKDESIKQVDANSRNVVPFYQNVTPVTDPAVAPSVNQQGAPVTATVAKGMNPQHGQAGHRCDIAVGAPLNSPVAAATNSQPQNAAAATYTVNNAAGAADETPTAEGMNPPHGQQNHRCDIAVGAPLDSK
jgi:hypothetical protein